MQQAERTIERPACGVDGRIIIMSASWKQLFFQVLLLLVSCRHINTNTPGLTPTPISPLPIAIRSVVLTDESQIEKVELLNPINLELECTWAGNQNKLPNITGFWRKDGNETENSRLTVKWENERYNLKRSFKIESEKDLGNYSCVFGNEENRKIDFVLTAPQFAEGRDKPVIGYVGDTAVIACKMEEPKPKPSTWKWFKANGTDKEQIFAAAEPHRYEIKNEERKTKLLVHNLTEADSGLYYCGAVYAIATTMGHAELKVITFYEPLKPFIAIVLEVIVLVAAILVYERSRSKKNHTAGNGMNEQTNTLTQGENNGSDGNSSMRQRKV